MEKARKRCDRQLHRARRQAGWGSVPSRGSWVRFAKGETAERDFSSVSLMNLSILSLSGQISANILFPFLAGKTAKDGSGGKADEVQHVHNSKALGTLQVSAVGITTTGPKEWV